MSTVTARPPRHRDRDVYRARRPDGVPVPAWYWQCNACADDEQQAFRLCESWREAYDEALAHARVCPAHHSSELESGA